MRAVRILAGWLLLLLLAGHAQAQYSSISLTAVSGSQINVTTSTAPGWEGYATIIKRWSAGTGQVRVYAGYPPPWGASFSDSGLAAGTTYYYCAVLGYSDEVGNYYEYWEYGGCGNTTSATTWSPPAAPYSLGATAVSGSQINLSWADGSGNETAFYIERNYVHVATVGANVTSYADGGLASGTTYTYRVRAANSVGVSGYTNEASATTVVPPSAPSGLSGVPASTTQINLSWADNASNETGFKLERKTGAGGAYSQIASPGVNATSYADTGVTAGSTYYYRVRATNSGGDSGYSNETSVSFVVPNAPSGLAAADLASGTVRLTWTDNSNSETGFKLERKAGAGGTYAQIATPAANATSQDDSGLAPGTIYYYRVRASGIPGDSGYSNEVGITATMPNVTSGTITYTYDHFGNLVETNAGGVITTLTYDLRGRKIQMADADMGTWTYAYNALGELIRQTDAKSQVTTMQYDLLGRLTSRTEPDLVSTWTYDACTKGVGKLCSVSSDNGYSRSQAYDSLGRPTTLSVTVDTNYSVTTSYDSAGRVDTLTYPTGFAVKNVYNGYGHLERVQRADAGGSTVFWQATSQNAAGQVTGETLGNGLTAARTYDTLFRLTAASASGGAGAAHSQTFSYDAVGNLTQRVDATQSVTENFSYDTLNRLNFVSGPAIATRTYDYNAIGNIAYKSDVGVYTYGTATVRPHAVASVSGNGNPNTVTASYSYDANGNLFGASGTLYPASGSVAFSRTLTYTSFNMPNALSHVQGGASYSYTYTYNSEHERVRLVAVRPDDTLTSIYLHPAGKGALLYEKETRQSDGRIEHKHYVNGGAGLVGVYLSRSDATTDMRYYHKDHLGSIAVITNQAGAVVERLAYEAFGERRNTDGSSENRASPIVGVSTDRGFTSHEHLDEMMLIHMNGRIYDPVLARFMTPDPFVQAPENLQSYNRYSYGFNNPLSGVDPSGYSFLDDLFEIGDAFMEGGGVFVVASWWLLGPSSFAATVTGDAIFASAYANAALAGGVGGFMSSGDLQGTLSGAASGALFTWAGTIGGSFSVERIAAHALAGCISGAISGAGCGSQALSAAAGKFVSAGLGELGLKQGVGGFVAATASGGIASKLGGDKYQNGAITAAFGYLFNECGATHMCGSDDTRVTASGNQVLGGTAHTEIQITGGYDYEILEGQPSLTTGKLVGRTNGANRGDAFAVDLTPPNGETMGSFALRLRGAARKYHDDLWYALPDARSSRDRLIGDGYNSNSYSSGILRDVYGHVPSSIPNAAARNGFRLPGWNNPIPLQ